MFFEYALTIPHNTPATAPAERAIVLALGEVTWWEIQFPNGCAGLVHCKVRDELHQVIPLNTDGDVSANNEHVDTFDSIMLTDEPATLILSGFNLDDTFDHTITFRFAVRSQADLAMLAAERSGLVWLDRWFRSHTPAPPV